MPLKPPNLAFRILTSCAFLSLALLLHADDSLARLRNGYSELVAAADTQRSQRLASLDTSYTAALERTIQRHRPSGKLDLIQPFAEEITRLSQATDGTLPALPATAPAELRSLREKRDLEAHKILTDHARSLTDAAAKLRKSLEAQETTLTRAGKVEDALAARQWRESLDADEALLAAQDLLQLGSTAGTGRRAMQIRRGGDHIEVLVHYDRAGKISPNSPITNTRERTQPGREIGQTTATTLGEFIGARGFAPHPFTRRLLTFDQAKLPDGFQAVEIETETRANYEGEPGIRLSYASNPKNPRVAISSAVPGNAEKGTYTITVRYLIPRENKNLTSFQFVHGAGSPAGGKIFQEQGKWTTESLTAESSHDDPTLLLYLKTAPGRSLRDAVDESILIHSIQIEQTTFSAFLQKRIDPQGKPLQEETDPAKQALIIQNGQIIEKN